MVTPKKIIIKDLELADEEIARLRKENKKLKEENKKIKNELKLYKYDRNRYFKELVSLKKSHSAMCQYRKDIPEIKKLERENKKLQKQIDKLKQYEALQLIKSGEPPATLADMERYGNKINK